MNVKKTIVLAMIALLSLNINVMAASGHGHGGAGHEAHDESHEEMKEGPHGGKLLEEGDFAVELTIFETGVPPEMRLYVYEDEQLVNPNDVDEVIVTLSRLGGEQNVLQFDPEQDYLVSDQVVTEPHSFDVEVSADFAGEEFHWHFESHEGRAEISDRFINLAGVKTEKATAITLKISDTLFGVIAAPEDRVYQVHAAYEGMVEKVHVKVGDKVKRGQTLVTALNTKSLQRYAVKSPASGEVTARFVNAGDRADASALVEVTNLSKVWVEMSAFPESIEKLAVGQKATIYDLHEHEQVMGNISYVAPVMTGGHIARARAVIDNKEGHWRPGMHVKADVEFDNKEVALAVKNTGLQSFRDMPVVFAKFGNTFEVRMLELGDSDGKFTEVLGGLSPDTEYVSENSFLLKADVLKDGASHDH